MAVYIIAIIDFVDEASYRRYQKAFPPIFARFSARLVAADENVTLFEGTREVPSKVVIMEFASTEEAMRFVEDPEYQKISEDRRAGATTFSVLADGFVSGREVA